MVAFSVTYHLVASISRGLEKIPLLLASISPLLVVTTSLRLMTIRISSILPGAEERFNLFFFAGA